MTTFKITVVFGQFKLIIPCNPDDCVRDLVEKSCVRYKKATRKPSIHQVVIAHLKTQKDGAILDDDDLLRDVLDDREQVIAVYEEWASYVDGPNTAPYANGAVVANLDNSVTSSNSSGDLGRANVRRVAPLKPQNGHRHFGESSENLEKDQLNAGVVVNESDFSPSKSGGLVVRRGSDSFLKVEAAVLAPLPNGSASLGGDASPLPPGLLDNEAKVSNHRRWSLTAPPSPPPQEQTPAKPPVQVIEKKPPQQISPIPPSFQRDGPARRSAVTDAERWIQSQIEKPQVPVASVVVAGNKNGVVHRSCSSSSVSSRSSSRSSSASLPVLPPPQIRTDQPIAKISSVTGEQFETVHLKQEPGALGIHVIPRVLQQNKLHMGLYLQAVEPQGRVGRANLLSPGDCIIAVNGVSLLEMPFASAQDTFRSELQRQTDFLELDVVRKNFTAVVTAAASVETAPAPPSVNVPPSSSDQVGIDESAVSPPQQTLAVPAPASTEANQSKSGIKASALTASGRKIRKRVDISLVKGSEGLGFTLASRDNETNPNDRQVVVKQIQVKGVAAADGRLRAGDRIIEINGRSITELTQPQAVAILKGLTEGSAVNLVITRLVDVNEQEAKPAAKSGQISPNKPSESSSTPPAEVVISSAPSGEPTSLAVPSSSLRQYLSYDIQLNDTGSAGLGVSLKASSKTTAQNLTHDLGIFIMKIIHGGAAHKDGRLKPNDQLVEVNGVSLLGKTNADAMDTLKQAILVPGPRPGYIRIRVARACKSDANGGSEDQNLTANTSVAAEQEQGIETTDENGAGVTDQDGGDVFMREAPNRQSMSEKRHNVYQDPRSTEAYRHFLELKQLQQPATQQQAVPVVPRPKSVEPDARVRSPILRLPSPPRQITSEVAGPVPHPPIPQQPIYVQPNGAPRRSASLESINTQQPPLQPPSGFAPTTVVLPPPQRIVQPMAVHVPSPAPGSSNGNFHTPPGASPFTRKSSLNQSFRSAVDRSAPAQINEGFVAEDNHNQATSTPPPERRVLPPQTHFVPVTAAVATTPPTIHQQRVATAPASSSSNTMPPPSSASSNNSSSGLKGFFRLGKGREQTGDSADTHHRQRFYDIERAKQQKLMVDQQLQQQQQQQVMSHQQRPSATSLHSLPANLIQPQLQQQQQQIFMQQAQQQPVQAYHHSPEYQRIPRQPNPMMSPPRSAMPMDPSRQYQVSAGPHQGIRQPPSYFQHQQMHQQYQTNTLLQPAAGRQLPQQPPMAGAFQPLPIRPQTAPAVPNLTQHIPPLVSMQQRLQQQPEVIYARPQVRPQMMVPPPYPSSAVPVGQPMMGVNTSRYPLPDTLMGNGYMPPPSTVQYRTLPYTPQQLTMGSSQTSAFVNGGIVRPMYAPPANLQPQQQQSQQFGYPEPSPTARV